MCEDEKFEQLLTQFTPMIYFIIRKLAIYKNKQEFYQIGCIALWDASLRFNEEKGEFHSFAYSYILGRMKSALTKEKVKQEKDDQLTVVSPQETTSEDDFISLLSHLVIDRVSLLLTANQSKWLKAYCLYGKTPSEIAKDEGVSISAVEAWRRDALVKIKKHGIADILSGKMDQIQLHQ
jgi:RNA polymerase sigma factor (sigma-70 family)